MPATMIIGSVVAAGASIYGANKAADAQSNAANSAINQQNQMYAQNKDILSPFIQAGQGQIGAQQQLLSGQSGPLAALNALTTPGANQNATLQQTPGYQFSLDQGLRASNNQLAARGLGGSGGAVAKGATNYAEGLAGNTWQSVVAALQNSYNSQAGAGQALINSGSQAGSALAGVGTSTANSIQGALGYQGNAQAGAANATGAAIGNNAFSGAAALNQLMNPGSSGVYTPQQIAGLGQMQAGSMTDAQANAYGISQGLV
jgi:hypothetical protein